MIKFNKITSLPVIPHHNSGQKGHRGHISHLVRYLTVLCWEYYKTHLQWKFNVTSLKDSCSRGDWVNKLQKLLKQEKHNSSARCCFKRCPAEFIVFHFVFMQAPFGLYLGGIRRLQWDSRSKHRHKCTSHHLRLPNQYLVIWHESSAA